ncbi:MAG: hypothetical protein HQK87_11990, partial [Nitrospinae bacterium]|nr:hypothetical protein [Nitrospinota bacterium]
MKLSVRPLVAGVAAILSLAWSTSALAAVPPVVVLPTDGSSVAFGTVNRGQSSNQSLTLSHSWSGGAMVLEVIETSDSANAFTYAVGTCTDAGAVNCTAGAKLCINVPNGAGGCAIQTTYTGPSKGSHSASITVGFSSLMLRSQRENEIALPATHAVTLSGKTRSTDKTLTLTMIGDGLVTGGGIFCGSGQCVQSFPLNTTVTLSASPSGYNKVFTGWSEDCTGIGTCSVTMDSDKNVTAT